MFCLLKQDVNISVLDGSNSKTGVIAFFQVALKTPAPPPPRTPSSLRIHAMIIIFIKVSVSQPFSLSGTLWVEKKLAEPHVQKNFLCGTPTLLKKDFLNLGIFS
jgi:hypothetical protein